MVSIEEHNPLPLFVLPNVEPHWRLFLGKIRIVKLRFHRESESTAGFSPGPSRDGLPELWAPGREEKVRGNISAAPRAGLLVPAVVRQGDRMAGEVEAEGVLLLSEPLSVWPPGRRHSPVLRISDGGGYQPCRLVLRRDALQQDPPPLHSVLLPAPPEQERARVRVEAQVDHEDVHLRVPPRVLRHHVEEQRALSDPALVVGVQVALRDRRERAGGRRRGTLRRRPPSA
eukprot:CAMPEP_0114513302 /NCGR_PEP_ID=MMETSP0109-20121206/15484_1 /TAXON_ID=29199 /ORGANISM="Chlorarachnion reptans, Strain CCCM449" /LENGTH=228 /DNA_ID=CAMNT_0001693139 /DNA_START=664 /DNA_END=1347 /DNA_ORIENTATION=+